MKRILLWYERKVTVFASFLILSILAGAGLFTFSFGSGVNPSRTYSVKTEYFGIDAEKIEKLITIPLEDALAGIQGIVDIRSVSRRGSSLLYITTDTKYDQRPVLLKLHDTVWETSRSFPKNAQRPVIQSGGANDRPDMIFSLSPRKEGMQDFYTLLHREIKPALENISGVNQVEIGGEAAPKIRITGNVQKLEKFGFSLRSVVYWVHESLGNRAVGDLETNRERVGVIVTGRLSSLEDLKILPIPVPGGSVPLASIAEITIGEEDPEVISRIDGLKRSLVRISCAPGSNTISISRQIHNELSSCPEVSFEKIFDAGEELFKGLKTIFLSLGIGMASVSVFLVLSTGSIRRGFPVVVSIPWNVFLTLGSLSLLKVPVDRGTLSGIAVGCGIVCDSAIIISSSSRGEEYGEILRLFPSLIASTVTTLMVLVPLFFLPPEERYLGSLLVSFFILITISFFTSIFFLPPVLPLVPERISERGNLTASILKFYRLHPHVSSVAALVLLFFTFFSFLTVPRGGNRKEEPVLFVRLEMDSGKSVEAVDSELLRISKLARKTAGVERVESMAKEGGGTLIVVFDPEKFRRIDREKVVAEWNQDLRESFLYLPAEIETGEAFIDIVGPDNLYLRKAARETLSKLLENPGFCSGVLHFKERAPMWVFRINRAKTSFYNISPRTMGQSLRDGLFGTVAAKWILNGKEMDIKVSGSKEEYASINSIHFRKFINDKGENIPLLSAGDFFPEKGPGRIYRINRQRAVTFSVKTRTASFKDIRRLILENLSPIILKGGHSFRIDPRLTEKERQYRLFTLALVCACIGIYLFLSAQHESFKTPLLILLSIPLSLSLPVSFIRFAGKQLSLTSLAIMTLTAGLVVNNTILLIDETIFKKNIGPDKDTFLAVKGALDKRIRPLFTTSGSTLAGLLPFLLSDNPASEFVHQAAVIVFTGIAGSFIITLFILPGLILAFPDLVKSGKRLKGSAVKT